MVPNTSHYGLKCNSHLFSALWPVTIPVFSTDNYKNKLVRPKLTETPHYGHEHSYLEGKKDILKVSHNTFFGIDFIFKGSSLKFMCTYICTEMCVCVQNAGRVPQSQKDMKDPLEWESQAVLSHLVWIM